MPTKQELADRNTEMNKLPKEKDDTIFMLQQEIENLKHNLKTNKGIGIEIKRIQEKEISSLKDATFNLETENNYLQIDNKKLSEELNWFKKVKNVQNARGAGRKPKVTGQQIHDIQKLKNEGFSYAAISQKIGLSVGTVYNIIKQRQGSS